MRSSNRRATASNNPARDPNITYTVERAAPARRATASSVTRGNASEASMSIAASSTCRRFDAAASARASWT